MTRDDAEPFPVSVPKDAESGERLGERQDPRARGTDRRYDGDSGVEGARATSTRPFDLESRLALLEARLEQVTDDVERLVKLVRGNGAPGLLQELLLQRGRVSSIESQLSWTLGLVAALLVAAVTRIVFS
jgi:hypothetical protein